MISEMLELCNTYHDVINFVTHTIIFIGTFYVALHNRNLPSWHVTPLWYIGLFCLFTNFTLVIEWTLGPTHEFSHTKIGSLAESLVDLSFASIAAIMLIGTIRRDLQGAKKRRRPRKQQS